IRELLSLIDYSAANPCLPEGHRTVFRNTKAGKYWTSTTLTPAPQIAWMMTLGIGPTVFDIKKKDNKTRLYAVRDGSKPSLVPQTGQKRCYTSDGVPLSDGAGTGQDGDIQAGRKWTVDRFEVDEDGTVTDHLTGLVWLKNANPF